MTSIREIFATFGPEYLQRYLGHSRLETTMLYLHLTQKGQEDAC